MQQHDQREEAERPYLAMGAVLKRRPRFKPLDQADVVLAYLRGEDALQKRLLLFEYHAQERLKRMIQLNAVNESLRQMLKAQAAQTPPTARDK